MIFSENRFPLFRITLWPTVYRQSSTSADWKQQKTDRLAAPAWMLKRRASTAATRAARTLA
jgi:hypothetical protein